MLHNALKTGDTLAIHPVSVGYTGIIFYNISVTKCCFDLLASIKLVSL